MKRKEEVGGEVEWGEKREKTCVTWRVLSLYFSVCLSVCLSV